MTDEKTLKEITDLASLNRYVKSSGLKMREAILRFYRELGENPDTPSERTPQS